MPFKTYEVIFFVLDDDWKEFDDMAIGCGSGSVGLNKALRIYNATTPTETLSEVCIVEYTYSEPDPEGYRKYMDDKVIHCKTK